MSIPAGGGLRESAAHSPPAIADPRFAVFDALPDIAVIVDGAGRITFVNGAWVTFASLNGGQHESCGVLVHLRRAISRLDRTGAPVAVLFLDLDGFKPVKTSTATPPATGSSSRWPTGWARQLRATDVVGRVGGDEFVAICDAGEAGSVVARLRDAIASPFQVGADTLRIGVSIGVAVAGEPRTADADDVAQALLSAADQAMYADKGRRRVSAPIG